MLEGWEWIIIGVVVIVVILWGPSKIPEFARSIGRAKGEFNKASKEFNDAANESSAQTVRPTTAVTQPTITTATSANTKTNDEMLIESARNMGISTDGKTRNQISEEISIKAKLLGAV